MKRSTVHRLANVAVWATLLHITFGGYTRGSGSGYGCKDGWPLCDGGRFGGWLPQAEPEMMIEWTHRLIALLLGILAILLVYAALRARSDFRWVTMPAMAAVLVIGGQAWLGRLVVEGDLDRDLVALHLFVSMVIVALFVIVAVASRSAAAGPHPLDRDWSRQLALGSLGVLVVLLLGAVVHDVYVPGWPLVNDQLLPDMSDVNTVTIHWLHRMASAAVFVYMLFLMWRGYRIERPRSEGVLVVASALLYMVNVGLGFLHVWTEVDSPWLVAAHLGIAAVVWTGLLSVTFLSFHDPR